MSAPRCGEFDRRSAREPLEGARLARWSDHLAGCADCREQERAELLLRGALGAAMPRLSPGFEVGLRRELERRAALRPAPARRRARLRPAGLWALALYGAAAAAAAVAILARLPWESLEPSPALGVVLGALALLSPLALVDRLGIVRPPG